MKAPSCTLGFRVKSGWAAAVLVSGPPGPPGPPGPRSVPQLLASRIIELSDPAVAESRQPYHAGFGSAQSDARKVDRLVRGIERFSRQSIADLLGEWRDGGRRTVRAAGVVVPSLTDPATLASPHMRAHASEGRLFRTVVVDGLEQCGVAVRVILERDVYALLGKALHRPASRVKTQVTALGDGAGRWRAEQKVAAAAAWLVS